MWACLPRIFTETVVRTIQCQVVSYNGWKAHGFRLNCTFILGKDSRWIPHISSTRTSCQKWQECILVSLCRPCYCFQHLQNCCLANKVVVESARTLIRLRAGTVKRLLKESGSGASSSFDGNARGSIYMLRTLVKARNWFAFAGSLQLSVLGGCSGSMSGSLLVLFGLQAMLLLSTNAELLTHQNYNNYNWQCYLNRPTCSMWAYLPRIFTETMVRTIQCQVVSYNGWKAHGFRLNCTFILGKDSRWIPHISSTRTSCQK